MMRKIVNLKNDFRFNALLGLFLLIILFTTCKKNEVADVASVKTIQVTDIMAVSAKVTGSTEDDGGSISEYGFCWSETGIPTIDNNKLTSGTSSGTRNFDAVLDNLKSSTTYQVAAWARAKQGVIYGASMTFTTQGENITVTTTAVQGTSIKISSATGGGVVSGTNGGNVTERGVFWGLTENVSQENKAGFTSDGNGSGTFTSNIAGLQPGKTYYVKAYARTSSGLYYASNVISFTTGILPGTAFTASKTNVKINESIQFTDQTTNNPLNWSWTFGDGTTSTNQNPSKSYSAPGSYTVSLKVTNAWGDSIKTIVNYITVGGNPPAVDFSASKTNVKVNESVQFTDKSTNSPATWNWTFGDGTSSTERNPVKSYTNTGLYSITLKVTNSWGEDSRTIVNYITVTGNPPAASFTASKTTVKTGESIQFTDQSANAPSVWLWTFGDGSTSIERNPVKTYTVAGTYSVTLKVVNAWGDDSKTITNYITVAGNGPVADFTASKTTAKIGENIQFNDQSTNAPTSWLWTFGDGTTSTERNPVKSYAQAGSYSVSLKVSNTGGEDEKTMVDFIKVTIDPPVANFSASKTSALQNETIHFTDKSTNEPTSWLWTFGDGTTSTEQHPAKAYSDTGKYTVSLKVQNIIGENTKTVNSYITISGNKPIAAFKASKTTAKINEAITFTDLSGNNPASWSWSFGDGTTSTEQNPVKSYLLPGVYNVSLKVGNAWGEDIKTINSYIVITGNPPVSDFIYSTSTVKINENIQFTDKSTNVPTSWLWSFGDGTTSTERNPVKSYAKAGVYSVSLKVKNASGEDTKTFVNAIVVTDVIGYPVAAFDVSKNPAIVNENIQFTDRSANSPTSWSWTFGDGTTSTEKNPIKSYGSTGSYTVTLKVKNESGEDTKSLVIEITDATNYYLKKYGMMPVQGGSFMMGCTAEQINCDKDETPLHSVTLSNYYLGKYEVTQALWEEIMGSNPAFFKGSTLPVHMVNWYDIQEFITKLNKQSGLNFRLPTEAEWEFAARGGINSNKTLYSGSSDIREVGWYLQNAGNTTNSVGLKKSNELGLYDMSGNVYEWCSDWYGNYIDVPQTNPQGPAVGDPVTGKVIRGGSWGDIERYCRVSWRMGKKPEEPGKGTGFRLAITPN
jgi:PKD repeat protein